jgi:glyoxylase-like metal-dependent hydrolase (beta-lactamase superfamily II)
MKRAFQIVGLVVAVLGVAVAVLVFTVFSPYWAKRVAAPAEYGRIRVLSDSMATMGIVSAGPDQVVLIDAGMDDEGKVLLAELARRKLGPEAVRAILLTHGHPDHVSGVPLFPKAEVMILEADVATAEGRAPYRGPFQRWFPVKPRRLKITRTLHDGESVAVGDTTFRVYAVPGHTGGSAAFLVDGVLFVGDSANATKEGAVRLLPALLTEDVPQNRASLVRLAARLEAEHAEVKTIVFSHSGALDSLAPLIAFAGASR